MLRRQEGQPLTQVLSLFNHSRRDVVSKLQSGEQSLFFEESSSFVSGHSREDLSDDRNRMKFDSLLNQLLCRMKDYNQQTYISLSLSTTQTAKETPLLLKNPHKLTVLPFFCLIYNNYI